MNWEAIGAIGELVSALAVVLTLGYLALPVAMRVAAKLEITKQFGDYTDLLLLNPDLFLINVKGIQDEKLDEVEKGKFIIMLSRATWYFSSMYFQSQAQSLSSEEWHESKILIDMYCSSPGYRKYWEVNSYRYSPKFAEYINERMAENDV